MSRVRENRMHGSMGGRWRRRHDAHEIYIDTGDVEANAEIFSRLLAQRTRLEEQYGRPLEFEELPGRRASRVAEYREGDVSQVDRHDEFIDWLFDCGERMRRALANTPLDGA